jgi:predicted Zn-dependent protease
MKYYKKSLLLAPGGDLFLMSVGVCYVQLGEKERGIRFLKRAAQISPNNSRIQKNLQAAEGY